MANLTEQHEQLAAESKWDFSDLSAIPCKYLMDDAGLEPATSALSRRRSPS